MCFLLTRIVAWCLWWQRLVLSQNDNSIEKKLPVPVLGAKLRGNSRQRIQPNTPWTLKLCQRLLYRIHEQWQRWKFFLKKRVFICYHDLASCKWHNCQLICLNKLFESFKTSVYPKISYRLIKDTVNIIYFYPQWMSLHVTSSYTQAS